MPYRVLMQPSGAGELAALPKPIRARVDHALLLLSEDPRPPRSVKLAGRSALHRVRVGDYRIVYEIRDAVLVVLIVRLGHRRDVYR